MWPDWLSSNSLLVVEIFYIRFHGDEQQGCCETQRDRWRLEGHSCLRAAHFVLLSQLTVGFLLSDALVSLHFWGDTLEQMHFRGVSMLCHYRKGPMCSTCLEPFILTAPNPHGASVVSKQPKRKVQNIQH